MPEMTPFEMYVTEFELRLKLIGAMGQWNKDMAAAEKDWADARLTDTKTATIQLINKELAIALKALKQEEFKIKKKITLIEEKLKKTSIFITAKKPTLPASFDLAWSSFDFFLGESEPSLVQKVMKLPVTDDHRSKTNFVGILTTKPQPSDAPADIKHFGTMKAWMQKNYYFFTPASPVHDLVLESMQVVRDSREKVIETLETKLSTVSNYSYKKIDELGKFLGLPSAAVKTPVTPNS